ncbi:5-oxoprolinase subunit PxpA [Marinicella sediminis]|uniref:5-oxoprolinase subunit PxpA n=1 Tax=Marinicella sediminis TaxID=1792834 RepID=A0ABV7JC27_9GAMM|nr:5-oxoprolinase subunit PxpA [Marinicella sediminis]
MIEPTQLSVDLNCDLGEYENLRDDLKDAAIMPFISSCNIACGGHAGNRTVIAHTVQLAMQYGVNMGAHPGFPDRANFGRSVIDISREELKKSLNEQIQRVKQAIESVGSQLQHVKPHGALYNLAADDYGLATLLVEMVRSIGPEIRFYGLANSAMAMACEQLDVRFVAEAFTDRAYQADGRLLSRSEVGAVIEGTGHITRRAIALVREQCVVASTGERVELQAETLCLHGDHPNSAGQARALHEALCEAGIEVKAPA